MKLKVILVALSFFAIIGCRKNVEPDGVSSIEIISSDTEFSDRGGLGIIRFSTIGIEEGTVRAESSEQWLTILEVAGNRVSYVLAPNQETEPRSACITIIADRISEAVTVSQKAGTAVPDDGGDEGEDDPEPSQPLSYSSFGCDADACQSEPIVLTDYAVSQWGEWDYEKDGDWFEVTRTENQFTISVSENTTGTDRRGSISIKAGDGTVPLIFAVTQTRFSGKDLSGHYVLRFGGGYWLMDFIRDTDGFKVKAVGSDSNRKTEDYSLSLGYVSNGDGGPKITFKLPQALGISDGKRLMLYATDPEGYYSITEDLGYELVYAGTPEKLIFDFAAEEDAYRRGFPYGFSGLFLMKGTISEDWMEPVEGKECLQLLKWGKGSHGGYMN